MAPFVNLMTISLSSFSDESFF